MNIPIVIAAYNRDHTLFRLLSSLAKSHYVEPVKLIISIDGGGPESVKTVARDFEWEFGPKEVIEHPENMGLRQHILFCGGLSQQYDGIILLEDDLFVSPWFYDYALSALQFYQECPDICGVSLYSYRYNETSYLSFTPLNDGSDTYFMQLPCSWGQAWLKGHWREFELWYEANQINSFTDDPSLPINISQWPATSWKKYFVKYMVEKNKFFAYPAYSYATNFGDKGQHHQGSNLYQVPIGAGQGYGFTFKRFEDSLVKYDVFYEILPECLKSLCIWSFNHDFCVDLHGTKQKENCSAEFVLTTKKCNSFIRSFARIMTPIEMNIIHAMDGNDIFLAPAGEVEDVNNIGEYIRNKSINIYEQQYYYNTDYLHYSLLHQAEIRVSELCQRTQVTEAEYCEATKLVSSLRASLSWRITTPLRKLLDLFRKV